MAALGMDFETFRSSVDTESNPPNGMPAPLQALWWDRKGEWERAHQLAQDADSLQGDWVHAYLHRVEGDDGNASYWYSRSRRPFFDGSLQAEWDSIAGELLGKSS